MYLWIIGHGELNYIIKSEAPRDSFSYTRFYSQDVVTLMMLAKWRRGEFCTFQSVGIIFFETTLSSKASPILRYPCYHTFTTINAMWTPGCTDMVILPSSCRVRGATTCHDAQVCNRCHLGNDVFLWHINQRLIPSEEQNAPSRVHKEPKDLTSTVLSMCPYNMPFYRLHAFYEYGCDR